eukprot:823327-Pleurochrysis_carterae.AAC.1
MGKEEVIVREAAAPEQWRRGTPLFSYKTTLIKKPNEGVSSTAQAQTCRSRASRVPAGRSAFGGTCRVAAPERAAAVCAAA